MKNRRVISALFVAFLLLSACRLSSASPAPTSTSPVPIVTPTATAALMDSTPTPIPATSTVLPPTATLAPPSPTATETPAPTPTPISRALDLENIDQAAQLMDYYAALDSILGDAIFSSKHTAFDLTQDGQRIAFGMCSSNDSAFICNAEAENEILVLDVETGALIQRMQLGQSRLADLAFSPDGETVYALQTTMSQTIIQAWTVESGQLDRTLFQVSGTIDAYPRLCLSPDGQFVAASLGSLGVSVYSIADQGVVFEGAGKFGRCSFSPDGQRLFVFRRDANAASLGMQVFDTTTWEDGPTIEFEANAVGLDVSPDGQQVAVAHEEYATIWDAGTGARVATLERPPAAEWTFRDLAFSPNGQLLIGLVADFSIDSLLHIGTVWETTGWQITGEIAGMTFEPTEILFDISGEQFVVFDWFDGAQRFGLPDAGLLTARATLEDYLDALHSGDYARAADLFMFDLVFDDTLPDWVLSQGGDPEDMAATFELACLPDAFPCLPLKDVLFAGRLQEGSYLFVITLAAPDGSAYSGPNGDSDFWLNGETDENGEVRITSLHPGAFAP